MGARAARVKGKSIASQWKRLFGNSPESSPERYPEEFLENLLPALDNIRKYVYIMLAFWL
jgi:hypothetical protein